MTELAERLKNSYERIVYPVAMGDMPIELEKMAIKDELGTITGYYSINSLAQSLGGKALVPKPFNQAGTLMHIRWSFDKGRLLDRQTDEEATIALLIANGLVDMSDGIEAKDIVIGDLVGNEFGVFGSHEFKCIPKEVIVEVTP